MSASATSFLPLIIGSICTSLHLGFGIVKVGFGSTFRKKGLTIHHHLGFPVWYYFTATAYIALSSVFWTLWLIVANETEEVLIKDVSRDLFDYVPIWFGTLLYVVLLLFAITTSLHILFMNFTLFQLHKQREARREIRIRDKSSLKLSDMGAKNIYGNNMNDGDDVERGFKKTALFNIETSHSCVAILVSLTSPINMLIQMIHQLIFIDVALLWLPMPFIEYISYQSLVNATAAPLQVLNETTMLEVHFGDFYFYWLKNKLLNVITFGIYERCCARYSYGEWLDQNLVWKREPPTGFNDDFKYFSARLLYWEVVVVFIMMAFSSITIFITLPIAIFWYRRRWMMKLKLGGRTPKLPDHINGCVYLNQFSKCNGDLNEYLDKNIEFEMDGELWYWDNGLHALKAENKRLRELLEENNIEIVISNSIHINPSKGASPKANKYKDDASNVGKSKEDEDGDDEEEKDAVALSTEMQRQLNKFIDKMLIKYNLTDSDTLNAMEVKPFIEEYTGHAITGDQCHEFLISIDTSGDGEIDKQELQKFIQDGLELPTSLRAQYAKRGEFHKTIVEFFIGVEATLMTQIKEEESKILPPTPKTLARRLSLASFWDNEVASKEITLSNLIDDIFRKYDLDRNNLLDAKEVKPCIEEYTGHVIGEERCSQFLKSIDGSGDGQIDKNEMLKFIEEGLQLSESLKTEYAQRGEFHKTIIDFFQGVGDHLKRLKLLKSEKIAVHDVESLLDQIWQLYDTEGLGSLDARNVKQLLKDFTGHEVDESMCKDFLESVDEDGDSLIEKNEMKTFIESGMELSEENRQAYASRGGLHKTIIDFFDGVNARLKFSNSPDKINNGKDKGIPIDKDMEIERLRKQFMGYKAYSSISSSKSSKTIDPKDIEIARLKRTLGSNSGSSLSGMKQGLSKSEIQTSIISPSSSKANNMNRSSSNITSLGSSKSNISPTMNPLLYQGVSKVRNIGRLSRNNSPNARSALGISAPSSSLSASKSNTAKERRRVVNGNVRRESSSKWIETTTTSPNLQKRNNLTALGRRSSSNNTSSVLGNRRGSGSSGSSKSRR